MRFSVASNASLIRNFSPQQQFWAFGQTVQGDLHFSGKEAMYVLVNYYSPGKFKNTFVAKALSAGTVPDHEDIIVRGTWRLRQVSVGWVHYFKGSCDEEDKWNLYGLAGFGLMSAGVENNYNQEVDSNYSKSGIPKEGLGRWRSLTFDLGLGVEYPLSAGIYIFGDLRTWIPNSDNNPSPFLHNIKNAPMPLMINGGVRIFFD